MKPEDFFDHLDQPGQFERRNEVNRLRDENRLLSDNVAALLRRIDQLQGELDAAHTMQAIHR